jgi:hypothetical protein
MGWRVFTCTTMYLSKTKSYNTIYSLKELKAHLNIDDADNRYNGQIDAVFKSVISEIEKYCSIDVAPTINQLEDYNAGGCYRIFESNISISAITYTNDLLTTPTTTSVSASEYIIKKGLQYTDIQFKNPFSAEKINITYTSGLSTLPNDLIHAVKLRVSYYFDADRNGSISTNVNETKAFERLISAYKNLII